MLCGQKVWTVSCGWHIITHSFNILSHGVWCLRQKTGVSKFWVNPIPLQSDIQAVTSRLAARRQYCPIVYVFAVSYLLFDANAVKPVGVKLRVPSFTKKDRALDYKFSPAHNPLTFFKSRYIFITLALCFDKSAMFSWLASRSWRHNAGLSELWTKHMLRYMTSLPLIGSRPSVALFKT